MDELKAKPAREMDKNAMNNDMLALNNLLALVNNSNVTGAVVPPEEKEKMKNFRPSSDIPKNSGSVVPAPLPVSKPEPEPGTPLPPVQRATSQLMGKAAPLIVLTGRTGSGKRFIAKQLLGMRNVVTGVTSAEDFKALRAFGAEVWHVMASEATRNRRLGAQQSRMEPLANAIDRDVTQRISQQPQPKEMLRVIWNDEVKPPSLRFYSLDSFLNQHSA